LDFCVHLVAADASERNVSIHLPKKSAPLFVKADATRLKQVVLNLLSNAVKYNVEGGRITIGCRVQSNGHIRVTVQDTGIGISPNNQERIFNAFEVVNTDYNSDGMGIGLAIAYQLVAQMDGVLGMESESGVGSTFWFELPHIIQQGQPEADMATTTAAVATPVAGRPRTILYVEDNIPNLKLVQQYLERHPEFRLLAAQTGAEGLRMARECNPDLVLLDINLPDIHGLEILRRLRTENLQTCPVVAVSANAMQDDVDAALASGCVAYLTKPFSTDALLALLKRHLPAVEKLQ